MKKLFTLLLAVSLLFSIAATSAAAEGTGGTMYPNPLQDVRVRQALWYAIDMDAIVDALWNGTVTAAHKSLVPEGYWQADGLTEYTYNPEKAKELLAEAGWDGSRTLKAVYYTGNLLDTITAIQAYWNDVVNDAKSITVEGNTVTFEFNNAQPNALTIFSQWPVLPKHKLESVAPENFSADTFWQMPIGTGPFKVETVKLGEYTILSRNADYFMPGTGNIEKLYLYPSTDAGDENLITNAKAGMIDYAFCKDSTQVQQLLEMSDYTVYTVNVTFPRYIFVNMFER